MKGWLLTLAAYPVFVVFPGCAVNEAVLIGHDFVDEAAAALRTGIDEYHAEDLQRIATARKHVVAAFVKDIVAAGPDAAGVEAKAAQFLVLLEKADRAARFEQERRRRMRAWLERLSSVNAQMREIAQWRLRWNEQMRTYVRRLREKADAVRSGNQSD